MSNQENPFEAIAARFNSLESLVLDIKQLVTAGKIGDKPVEDEILNVRQASDLLNLAIPTIYSFTSKRKLPHSKRGKKLYFKKSELLQWIQSGRRSSVSELREKAKNFKAT